MRRSKMILALVVLTALLMAVSALPALSAPPLYTCEVNGREFGPFGPGKVKSEFTAAGNTCTKVAEAEPGKNIK